MCSCSVGTSARKSKKIPCHQIRSMQTTTRRTIEERTDQEPPTNTRRRHHETKSTAYAERLESSEIVMRLKGCLGPALARPPTSMIGPRRSSRNKGCQGRGREFKGCRRRMMAGEHGQRVLRAPSPERYKWSPKGCARCGISTGHRDSPER